MVTRLRLSNHSDLLSDDQLALTADVRRGRADGGRDLMSGHFETRHVDKLTKVAGG